MMRVLAFLFLLATPALAQSNTQATTFQSTAIIKAMNACAGGSNHTTTTASDACVLGTAMNATTKVNMSFQCVWASLGGTPNATVTLETSNDRTTWTAKTGATFTVSGASGNQTVSLVNATEAYFRLVYVAGTTTGGTMTCNVNAK